MEKKLSNPFFGESRRIFMAGMLANIMYLMMAAALASNFFEKVHVALKIFMAITMTSLAGLSILV